MTFVLYVLQESTEPINGEVCIIVNRNFAKYAHSVTPRGQMVYNYNQEI